MLDQVQYAQESKWKEAKEFKGFLNILEGLNDDKKKIQELNVSHFLRIITSSLTKHFDMRVSADLLFLSLFIEQKICTCISKLIMGINENISENCVSSIHKQGINILKLKVFLSINMLQTNMMILRSSSFMQTHAVPMHLIASGYDM